MDIPSDYSLILDLLSGPLDDSTGFEAIYFQPTHIGTAEDCLNPSPRNFHSNITQCVHVLKPTLVKGPLFKCNGAPRCKELTQHISIWACFAFNGRGSGRQ